MPDPDDNLPVKQFQGRSINNRYIDPEGTSLRLYYLGQSSASTCHGMPRTPPPPQHIWHVVQKLATSFAVVRGERHIFDSLGLVAFQTLCSPLNRVEDTA